ncbi:MAG: T9SS type A sorting domain-containing protein [Flavobacteriales bacterium]|nr:T9SS type A sorting domain-containing protein [Flavobacteriales bacterium]
MKRILIFTLTLVCMKVQAQDFKKLYTDVFVNGVVEVRHLSNWNQTQFMAVSKVDTNSSQVDYYHQLWMLNLEGDTIWTKTLSEGDNNKYNLKDFVWPRAERFNSNIVVSHVPRDSSSSKLTMLDSLGNQKWTLDYGMYISDIVPDGDSLYIAGFIPMIDSAVVIRLDSNGQIIRRAAFRKGWTDDFYSSEVDLELLHNGSLLLTYNDYPAIQTVNELVVQKIDGFFNQIWLKKIGRWAFSHATYFRNPIIELTPNTYVFGVDSTNNYAAIHALDSNGNRKWVTRFADTDFELARNAIIKLNDNRFVINSNNVTSTNTNNPSYAMYDSTGVPIFERRKGYVNVVFRKHIWGPYNSMIYFDDKIVMSGEFYIGPQIQGYVISYDTLGRHTPKTDSVWAGDCDHDGTAFMYDLFPIGLYYDSTGFERNVQGSAWTGYLSPIWTDTSSSGINYRTADVDGDGMINVNDVGPIKTNYGLVHNKTESSTIHSNAANLKLEVAKDSVAINDSLSIIVKIGDINNQMDSLYGIAFSVNYDAGLLDTSQINVDYSNSWLGDVSNVNSMITLDKNQPSSGRIDVALVRTNRLNAPVGFGEICAIEIFTTDDLSGKGQGIYESMDLTISNIRAISVGEINLPINSLDTSIIIFDSAAVPTYVKDSHHEGYVIYPNPTSSSINISGPIFDYASVLNQNGSLVLRTTKRDISLDHLPKGVYYLQIVDEIGSKMQKLVVY